MAGSYRCTGGTATNGFAPRTLLREKSAALAENGYPVTPDMHVVHAYVISVRSIPIMKPLVRGNKGFHGAQLTHYWRELTSEERDDPCWNPENPSNASLYEAAFRRLFDEEMTRWEGPGLAPRDKKVAGRETFWSMPHRTLQNVMDHISAGGSLLEWSTTPYYEASPPPPAHAWAWRLSTPYSSRSTASSSRVSSSSSCSRDGGLLTPKLEPMQVKPKPRTAQEASLYDELKAA